jgi:hypothetical protein
MQTTLENRKKTTINFPKSVLKKKNRVEEGGALCLGVKREQRSIDLRAQKMMKGKMEPSTIPTMVKAVPQMVKAVKQTATVPHMTSPQEKQPKE